MNNDQFRRLVLDQPGTKRPAADNNDTKAAPSSQQASLLGSRLRSSIPMTPRNVFHGKADFARQLAEHRGEHQQPPTKRFKASAAPKGTKLASGYQDRTALRRVQQDEGGEDRREGKEGEAEAEAEGIEQRLKALEELVKLGQIDSGTFEKLRREIGVGGDLGSTHLIKGLDWDLLQRVKAGEDVSKVTEDEEEEGLTGDVDEEFDRVLEQKEDEIGVAAAAPREKKVKKGNLATGRMSRDEILRQLKASRVAAPPPESTLGTRFKRIKDDKPEKKRWIETDASGRRKEILEITDADGKTKRKSRWLGKKAAEEEVKVDGNGLLLPDHDAKPLGMEVPAVVAAKMAAEAAAAAQAEEEDDDIFAGVGTDYNPLAGLEDDDSEDDEEEAESSAVKEDVQSKEPSIAASVPAQRRNYFNDKKTEEVDRSNPLKNDPTILAALKRAAALHRASPAGREGDEDVDVEGGDEDPEILAHRKKFFEERRRREAQDAQDMDYGFGSSRIEDEEDEEGPTVFDGEQRGANKRKRGPKKRKGDKDSAVDVLRVMEGRKNQ